MARSATLSVDLLLKSGGFTKGMHEAQGATKGLDHSLDGLKHSQLAVRESSLRVAQAQERLNKLQAEGRARSTQLERAEIALEKAQLRQSASQRQLNTQMTRGVKSTSMLGAAAALSLRTRVSASCAIRSPRSPKLRSLRRR